MTRPVPAVHSQAPAQAPVTEQVSTATSDVPAYVDDTLPEPEAELEVPRVVGVDAEREEIDLPDFLRG